MSSKNDSKSPATPKPGRLNLARESLRNLGVTSGVKTGVSLTMKFCITGEPCWTCGPIASHIMPK